MALTSARSRAIKAKGRSTEQAVVDLARVSGWPHAERRRLTGTSDRGDVTGMPSIVVEVKSGARIDLAGWLRETEAERVNDGADYGITVIKLKGLGDQNAGQWAALLPLAAMLRLLAAAGYGDGPTTPPPGVTRYPPGGAATSPHVHCRPGRCEAVTIDD